MSMMHHLIICACGKVYKQILLKIFQNINQDNLHYSHILLPLHFFNYVIGLQNSKSQYLGSCLSYRNGFGHVGN